MGEILFQTSLIAAFVAGMVALFAPCCITFLLPAYLGSVFKEKEKVLVMTLVFGAGIFVVLLPAVVGVAFISQALFRYHNLVYYLSGSMMLLVSLVTLVGIKLPLPYFSRQASAQKTDVGSIFMLGMFSGITSACCAPVLIGILTLTFLSPSFLGALAVGGMYVLGMVTPLLLISLFLDNKVPNMAILRRPIIAFKIGKKSFFVSLSNLVGAVIFFVTGFFTLIFTYTGILTEKSMEKFTQIIGRAAVAADGYLGNNLVLNGLFFFGVILFIYWIIRKAKKE
ncbi:MAG: cytochrome c biogenesis protein CcdA [Candidatus Shapirobacteria bacterium]